MNNIFTEYLERNGWEEVSPCSYKNQNFGSEIFFDTSNQIEIYASDQRRVGSYYLKDVEDLIEIVKNIDQFGR